LLCLRRGRLMNAPNCELAQPTAEF